MHTLRYRRTVIGATSASASDTGFTQSTAPFLVKFKPTATSATIDAAIKTNGGTSIRELDQIRTRIINVPASAQSAILAAYSKDPSVERATAAIKMKKVGDPNDPGYAQQWALTKINWNAAYGVVPISGTSTIAVLDTGVDASHPDLASIVSASGYSSLNGVTSGDSLV
jgi:hypothetical protein